MPESAGAPLIAPRFGGRVDGLLIAVLAIYVLPNLLWLMLPKLIGPFILRLIRERGRRKENGPGVTPARDRFRNWLCED